MITIAYQDEASEHAEVELQRFAEGKYTVSLTPDLGLTKDYGGYVCDGARDCRILEVVTGNRFQWYGSVRVVDINEDGEPVGEPYVVVVDRVELY